MKMDVKIYKEGWLIKESMNIGSIIKYYIFFVSINNNNQVIG